MVKLAHYHLGRYQVTHGQLHEGIEQLEKTLEPEDARTPQMQYGLADAYFRARRISDAIVHARKAKLLADKYGQTELAGVIAKELQALEGRAGR